MIPDPPSKAERFVALRRAVITDDQLSAAQRRSALSELADAWLGRFFDQVPASARRGVALVAVGGYGRQELLPGSDLDVLLLLRDGSDAATVAEKVFYPVWDAGLALDHSTRTTKEALDIAGDDLRVALGLIDARHVAGDAALTERLRTEARAQWRQSAQTRLPALAAMCRDRAERFGELAHLLEPDLVQAYGGLRDSLALRAVSASWVADRPHTAAIERSRQWLLTIRDTLHRITGRRHDRLLFDDQAVVADRLALPDPDALLRRVAEAGRQIAYAADVTWREVERTLTARKRRPGTTIVRRPLGPGVVEHDGEAVLARDVRPERDPVLPLRAGAAAAQAGLVLSPRTVQELATACPPVPEPWPPAARDALVSLLGAGHNAVPVWDSLEACGLVVRWFPEWESIRYRPTRTPVHRHTVDRHLVETAAIAAGLTRRVARPDLLLLAALFHDLGKGVPGDHSQAGETIARDLGHRLGLCSADATTLGLLVRHHLMLPEMAIRRDPDDPATVAKVVDAVRSREFLELLAALTEADATAAGPLAWSPLRARLVGDLVRRVRDVLDGSPAPEPSRLEPWQQKLAGDAALAVHVDSTGPDGSCLVTVVAPNSPALLAGTAGVLALNRIDVRTATTHRLGDTAVLVWRVQMRHGDPPDEVKLRDEIGRAMSGGLDLSERLATRAGERTGRVIAHAQPRLMVLPDVSTDATVLEARAHDEPGLLFRLTTAVSRPGVTIRSAVVETLGSEAVDVFYLVDETGEALTREATAQVVSAAADALTGR